MSELVPNEPRPNVIIDMEVAERHEYGGMDMSINLEQMRIWTGFDLLIYTDAGEFLEGIKHLLQFAAPALTLKEKEDSDWADDELQWGIKPDAKDIL